MPGTKVGPKDAAQEFLIANARKTFLNNKVIPNLYTQLDPQQIYDFLLVNWADHKGNAAMVYGTVGRSAALSAAFDFGALICPGIVSLNLRAGAQITVTNETIMLIHRLMPDKLISISSRLQLEKQVENTVNKPVSYMVLQGNRAGVDFELSTSASIGTDNGLSGISDKMPLSCFGLNLEAGISGKVSGGLYRYYDNRPGFYENSRQENLLNDFTASLGTRHTHYLKREAVAWLREVKKKYVDPKSGSEYANLKAQFKSLPSFNWPGFRASTEKVNAKLAEILDALDVLPSSEKSKINNSITRYKNNLKRAVAAQKDYLVIEKEGRERGRNVVDHLCYINLKNIKKGGHVSIRAEIGTDFSGEMPKEINLIEAAIPTISIGAGAEAKYKSVRTFYRYQGFAFGVKRPNRIVYTQDVMANYSEVDVTIAMKASLQSLQNQDIDLAGVHVLDQSLDGIDKPGFELLKEKNWIKCSLRYKAVVAYWNHRNSQSLTQVKTLNGSGLSFGCSMRIQDLLFISFQENQGGNDSLNKKVQHFAALLRVTNAQFREFAKSLLAGSELETGKNAVIGFEGLEEYGAVLVESSFRFKQEVTLKMAQKNKDFSQTQVEDLTEKEEWKDFFNGKSDDPAEAGVELEAIRVRLRLGDHTNNTRNVFKLGLTVLGSGIEFDFDSINEAGNEGILEIHTHHFIEFDQDLNGVPENLRDEVPPPILIPHHFNE